MRRPALLLLTLLLSAGAPVRGQGNDDGLLRNMLEVFLGASDLANAGKVADKGAARFPKDPYWPEKRGDIAVWSSRHAEALKNYMTALRLGADTKLRVKVRNLALGLRDYASAAEVLEAELRSGKKDLLKELVSCYEHLGYPEKALTAVNKYGSGDWAALKKISLLTELGRIDEAAGSYAALIARRGQDPALAEAYAQVLFSQRRIREAYKVLKNAEPKALPENTDFWHALASAAHYAGDQPAALRAAGLLRASGEATLQEYEWLIDSASLSDPGLAAAYAAEAWKKYRNPYIFLRHLQLCVSAKDPETAAASIKALSRGDLEALGASPGFWGMAAAVHLRLSDNTSALNALLEGQRANPGEETLAAQLLWHLIVYGPAQELRPAMQRAQKPAPGSDSLKLALAYAHYSLNEPVNALRHLGSIRNMQTSARMLRADALEMNGQADEARLVRLTEHRALKNSPVAGKEAAAARARLCSYFCTATEFHRELLAAAKLLEPAELQELQLARASVLGDTQRAAELAAAAGRRLPWAEFYHAILTGDRQAQDRLLRAGPERLPLKDRISSLAALGYRRKAASEAFGHLDKAPGDTALFQAAAGLYEELSPALRLRTEAARRSGVEELAASVSFSAAAGAGARLGAVTGRRKLHTSPGSDLRSARGHYSHAALTYETGLYRSLKALAGIRSEQKDFFFASAQFRKQAARRTWLGIKADYSGYAQESLDLYTGGVRDSLGVSVSHSLRGGTVLQAEAEGNQYYSQDRDYLGRQRLLKLDLSRPLRWHIWRFIPSVSAAFSDGREAPVDTGGRLGVSVSGARAGIPGEYSQYGAALALRKNRAETFSRELLPNLTLAYYDNSRYGAGGSASAGFSTSLFKRDILRAQAEYGAGISASADIYRRVWLEWQLHF